MTETQQKIIKLIARHQLENAEAKGVSMKDLLATCNDEMLAASTKQLKEYLREAREHKVVTETTLPDGQLLLACPYDAMVLQKLIDN